MTLLLLSLRSHSQVELFFDKAEKFHTPASKQKPASADTVPFGIFGTSGHANVNSHPTLLNWINLLLIPPQNSNNWPGLLPNLKQV